MPTKVLLWSGRRDSNPQQPAWKAGTLPLSYFRIKPKPKATLNTISLKQRQTPLASPDNLPQKTSEWYSLPLRV